MMFRMNDWTRDESQHVVRGPREVVAAVSFRNQVYRDNIE